MDPAHHAVRLAEFRGQVRPQIGQIGLDADAEVDLRVPHQREVSVERALRIGLAVDRDDELAAAAHPAKVAVTIDQRPFRLAASRYLTRWRR
jgi:hypothetical protein